MSGSIAKNKLEMLPDLLPDFTEFVPYLSFARRLFAACMALSSLAAASPCIVSVTCEYRSRVIPTEAWPNRTYLITQWLPNGISLLPQALVRDGQIFRILSGILRPEPQVSS